MTQGDLLTVPSRLTLTARLAAYFRNRPLEFIDGMELARIAGSYAWRSRISNVRQQCGMQIENRQRRINGRTISEYRYVPPAQTSAA